MWHLWGRAKRSPEPSWQGWVAKAAGRWGSARSVKRTEAVGVRAGMRLQVGVALAAAMLWSCPGCSRAPKPADKPETVVFSKPYTMRADAPADPAAERRWPFVNLQRRYWEATTWSEVQKLHTPESIAWLESVDGEAWFHEARGKESWKQAELIVTAYVQLELDGQAVILAQSVVGGGDPKKATVFRVDGYRKMADGWKIDKTLEASTLGAIVTNFGPADLEKAVQTYVARKSSGQDTPKDQSGAR